MATRITVVEDESTIAEILQYNLEREGYRVEVAHRGDTALEILRARPPELILLDLMLPGLDGFEITRLLKRDPITSNIRLVMLTARDKEIDRIVGFELGADDYITKPFSPREVVLRINAIMRRADTTEESTELLSTGPLKIDPLAHRVWVHDQEINLTSTELTLLRILMQRRGRAQTRSNLLQDVWGYDGSVESRTLDTHIGRLRRKLGPAADQIETVIGIGYRLRG